MMYPYLLYPMQAISLTSSIFMTVAIAFERYNAIRKPFFHRYSISIENKYQIRYDASFLLSIHPIHSSTFLFIDHTPPPMDQRSQRIRND